MGINMCHIYLLKKTMGINMLYLPVKKNNGNKHVSYLPVKKNNGNKHVSYLPVKNPMGINMCYIYLLKKNALHTTELVNIEFDLFLSY
jgi:hypothetical protein